MVYDCLREVLEALAIKKGFKIYNHECFCAFLKNICNEFSFAESFDRFRKIRNKINYYGKKVELVDAERLIKDMISLRKELLSKFF